MTYDLLTLPSFPSSAHKLLFFLQDPTQVSSVHHTCPDLPALKSEVTVPLLFPMTTPHAHLEGALLTTLQQLAHTSVSTSKPLNRGELSSGPSLEQGKMLKDHKS